VQGDATSTKTAYRISLMDPFLTGQPLPISPNCEECEEIILGRT